MIFSRFSLVVFPICLGVVVFAWSDEVRSAQPARIFSDHMVLQREASVPIWGQGNPGDNIVVRFARQTASATADANGQWQVELTPMKANAINRDLFVQVGENKFIIRDVLVGEVWFAGGQSNMAHKMGSSARKLSEAKALVTTADYPGIRFRKISESHAPTPRRDLRGGDWIVCSPKSARGFSAVGFVYARRLHLNLGVPVGVIDCSWGGTPIEPYIPFEAFVGHPTLEALAELASQKDYERIRNLPGGTFVRDEKWLAGAIFNGRIAPVVPYAIRGAIWYQGESNCGKGEDPRDYAHKMRALIQGWRDAWGKDDLPVYFVQLPQWNSYAWTFLREEQRLATDVKNTGMAVTVDLDNVNDIHPPNKIDVGERLARWPLAKLHSRKIGFSGPVFREIDIQDDIVKVMFDHTGEGLMVGQSTVGKVTESKNVTLHGFELAGSDATWYAAEAEIQGSVIKVSSPNVPIPVAVRYACHPIAPKNRPWNLYNRAGLPASPFCSDWSLMSYQPTKNPR